MEKQAAFARFDEMGEAQVTKLVLSWGTPEHTYAFEWLRLRSEAASARNDASQAEQARTARIAKNVAVAALIVATIAAIPAIKDIIALLQRW